jgi:alcohol dehydrogenase
VLDALRDVRSDEMLAVARLFGIEDTDPDSAVARLPVLVRDLVRDLGIPTTLQQCGIAQDDLAALVKDALGVTRLAKAFPVPDVPARYAAIVQHAWHGDLSAEAPHMAPRRAA